MSAHASDCELVAKAISGDRAALHGLLHRHYRALATHISSTIPQQIQGEMSAEDVVQQTFVQAIRGIKRFSPRNNRSFYAWLVRIADNAMKDVLRHHNVQKRVTGRAGVLKDTPSQSNWTDLVEVLSAGSHTPSRSAVRHEAVAAVREAMDLLPDDYRQAVQLRLFLGKSLSETADIMGSTPRAVQGLVDRAKTKMRAELGRLSLYE